MSIHIERLTRERKADFFDFFDNLAFADHEEWAGCFCLESHLRSVDDVEYTPDGHPVKREDRKAVAGELIDTGVMTGYLIYDGDMAVGWCSAGDKCGFGPVLHNEVFRTDEPMPGRTVIIYCFDIAAEYRGRKLADRLLDRVIADAKAEGFSCVEGYPYTDAALEYQYRGPRRLYEKHGFELVREGDWITIMRLAL